MFSLLSASERIAYVSTPSIFFFGFSNNGTLFFVIKNWALSVDAQHHVGIIQNIT
jgi:hypothetical protein